MRWTEIGSILLGCAVGFFGLMIVAGSLVTLGQDEELSLVAQLALIAMLGVAPMIGGGWLIWRPFASRSRRQKEALERSILGLVERSDGILTPAQVARSTELTLDEAKAALDEMLLSGHCTSDMREDGQIVYRFAGSA